MVVKKDWHAAAMKACFEDTQMVVKRVVFLVGKKDGWKVDE